MTEMKLHRCVATDGSFQNCSEELDGTLMFDPDYPGWESTRVNFCPFCGYETKYKIKSVRFDVCYHTDTPSAKI